MKNHQITVLVLCALFLLSACGRKQEAASSAKQSNVTPAGVPACPGLISTEKSDGNAQVGSSSLVSSQAPEQLLDFYTTTLAGNGWVLGTSAKQEDDHHLLFQQGARFLRIQLGPAKGRNGGAHLNLIWGQRAGSKPIRESYEPEHEQKAAEDDGGGRGW